jgi:hypothetical protein
LPAGGELEVLHWDHDSLASTRQVPVLGGLRIDLLGFFGIGNL